MFQIEQQKAEKIIHSYCKNTGLPEPIGLQWNPIPFSGEWGISTSFFRLAAQEARQQKSKNETQKSVPVRAQEIASEIAKELEGIEEFSHIEAKNGYLNLYFSTQEYSNRVISTILQEGDKFGYSEFNHKRIMVEFSQPNTHKAFHVGHLRNVILGASICNILEAAGYDVIRTNYIGDIGLHVIKWLWNYIKFHTGEEPGEDKTRWMGDLYAEADKHLANNPQYEAEVRELFSRWDNNDPEIVALWEKTRKWSLEGFDQIYQMLGVSFDKVYYESEVEEPGKKLVEKMIQDGIAIDERPEGPVIVRLDDLLGNKKEEYRVLVVLRSDGTSLYSTKDLALAIQKFSDYDLYKSIYVIDVRQSLYMRQIFKTLEIMGYAWAKDCYHLAYEIVTLPGNVTMSSREGTVVLLEDLVREATIRAKEIVENKNPSLTSQQKDEISHSVALGALKYTMLARDNTKIVTFDWESAMDFDGQAAPYIQYAHVRANSILKRFGTTIPNATNPSHKLEPTEIQLIDLLSRFPSEVQRAAEDLKPLHLTNLAYQIAKAFNDFYNQCPVIKAEPEIRVFRIRLVAAVKQTLANILKILGISAPNVM